MIQLDVDLPDRPGEFAKILRILAVEKINIDAMSANSGNGHSYVSLITDRPIKARQSLRKAGFACSQRTVLVVRVTAWPGTAGSRSSPSGLFRYPAADPGWFWGAAVDDLGIPWQRRPRKVLDTSEGIEFARWWRGGAFDHSRASLEPWAAATPDEEALAWEGEDGSIRRFTHAELDREVRRAAAMLAADGIGEGSRVAIFLPMLPETVIAVLALGRLRAVFTPIFSGYAGPAVAIRLRAFEASHVITADGFLRRGKVVGLKAITDEAVAESPTVRRVFVVRRLGSRAAPDAGGPVPFDPAIDAWWEAGLPERPHDVGRVPVTRWLSRAHEDARRRGHTRTPRRVLATKSSSRTTSGTSPCSSRSRSAASLVVRWELNSRRNACLRTAWTSCGRPARSSPTRLMP